MAGLCALRTAGLDVEIPLQITGRNASFGQESGTLCTQRNIEVIWLLRSLKPDFKTIADLHVAPRYHRLSGASKVTRFAAAAKGGERPSRKVDGAVVRSLIRQRRTDNDDAALRFQHGFHGYAKSHHCAALMKRPGSHDFRQLAAPSLNEPTESGVVGAS